MASFYRDSNAFSWNITISLLNTCEERILKDFKKGRYNIWKKGYLILKIRNKVCVYLCAMSLLRTALNMRSYASTYFLGFVKWWRKVKKRSVCRGPELYRRGKILLHFLFPNGPFLAWIFTQLLSICRRLCAAWQAFSSVNGSTLKARHSSSNYAVGLWTWVFLIS